MKITKKWVLITLVVCIMAGVSISGWSLFGGQVNALKLDLTQPDAWIHTSSLAKLPRDILHIPIARDVLTEDFVYYYEQNDDRLGLKGSLRRIAYEHALTWTDRLLASTLNEPADVAVWRDHKGKLQYYLIAMTRSQWAKLLQGVGETVLKQDSQLTLAGTVRDGLHSIPLLAFNYTNRRTLLVASKGDRIVIFSDPGMLLDSAQKPNAASAKVLLSLLSEHTKDQAIYATYFHTGVQENLHTLVFSANFLSLGYQHFFPGLQALRFEFAAGDTNTEQGGHNRWSTQVLLDSRKIALAPASLTALWKSLPVHPAACASLPVEWSQGNTLFNDEKTEKSVHYQSLMTQLDGPAGVCWFKESHLHTPVFVATLKPDAKVRPADLTALYQWTMRLPEVEDKTSVIQIEKINGGMRWSSEIQAPFGINSDQSTFQPTLIRIGNKLVFSPDRALTDMVVRTVQRRYPNIGDVLPDSARALAVLEPHMLAEMTEHEAFAALPKEDEPVFYNAAKQHLLPKLAALKKYPGVALIMHESPANGLKWQRVDWRDLAQKKAH